MHISIHAMYHDNCMYKHWISLYNTATTYISLIYDYTALWYRPNSQLWRNMLRPALILKLVQKALCWCWQATTVYLQRVSIHGLCFEKGNHAHLKLFWKREHHPCPETVPVKQIWSMMTVESGCLAYLPVGRSEYDHTPPLMKIPRKLTTIRHAPRKKSDHGAISTVGHGIVWCQYGVRWYDKHDLPGSLPSTMLGWTCFSDGVICTVLHPPTCESVYQNICARNTHQSCRAVAPRKMSGVRCALRTTYDSSHSALRIRMIQCVRRSKFRHK